jgi:hypothetical protein
VGVGQPFLPEDYSYGNALVSSAEEAEHARVSLGTIGRVPAPDGGRCGVWGSYVSRWLAERSYSIGSVGFLFWCQRVAGPKIFRSLVFGLLPESEDCFRGRHYLFQRRYVLVYMLKHGMESHSAVGRMCRPKAC